MRALVVLLAIGVVAGSLRAETEAPSNRDFAEQIFRRLIAVTGRGGSVPRLHIQTESEVENLAPVRRAQERIAFLRSSGSPPRREVVLDEKTIGLCRAMQARAESCLAFFVGHELSHYVNHHDWGPHFARKMGFADAAAAADPSQHAAQEAQADDFGLLYAALAGYDSMSACPDALASVYQAYDIPEALPGYMTLLERQQIAARSRIFLQRMLPLFDAANFSMATGRFGAAATLYEAILEQFPSREIFNNAAVAAIRLATAGDGEKYPWLLDSETRLPRVAPSRGAAETQNREQLLQTARDRLENAIALDSQYAPAHVNLGLLSGLRNESFRARAEFADARRLSNSAAVTNAVALGEAVELFREGRQAEARSLIQTSLANNRDDTATRWWCERISGEKLSPAADTANSGPVIGRSELWPGGRSPRQLAPARPERISFPDGLVIETALTSRYRWFSLRFPGAGGSTLSAIVTTVEQLDDSNPLRLKVEKQDWGTLLGSPSDRVNLFPGRGFFFEELGLLLLTDENERLVRYLAYE